MERNRPLDTQNARRHCRMSLTPKKTPPVWCQIETFPLTGSGEIQKIFLRNSYLTGQYVSNDSNSDRKAVAIEARSKYHIPNIRLW
jgi:hypothetical protein